MEIIQNFIELTLTDFDLEDVMDGTEEFPFPEDMDAQHLKKH